MPIDGISVVKADKYAYCCIDEFTEELKQIIREELNIICYGKRYIEENDKAYYSYEATLKEFLLRYDRKSQKTQVGMIGELLAHILICRIFTDLEAISIYFNKEERSIKKGFDLNYLGKDKASIWYGEVKSGERQLQTVNAKNISLLNKAKDDLSEKLGSGRRSLWDAAINDVAISIASNREKTISDILRKDLMSIQGDVAIKKSGVLVSVLFHDVNNKIGHQSISDLAKEICDAEVFSDVILFSIQKSTFARIVVFLREEAQ